MSQIINPPTVNYMPQQGQDFMQSYLEGLKFGQDLQAFKKQQELNAKQQLFQQDYANLTQNPSGKGMLDLMVKYPEFAANLKPIQDTYATAEKQGELSTILQIDNAMTNNNFPLAKKLVEQAKVAFANAGKDTKNLDIVLQTIDESPETAKGSIEMTAAMLLGDKYKTFQEAKTEQLTQSLKVKELEAKIVKLNAEGKFEEAKALGEQLKNQASAAAKIDLSLLPGLSESIMQIETNPNAALTTLKSERIYAHEQGADTYVYDKAIRFLDEGDLESAKAVISSQLSKSPDYKNIIAGTTDTLEQSSKVKKSKSEANFAVLNEEYKKEQTKSEILQQKLTKARTSNEYKEGDIKTERLKGEILENDKRRAELKKQKNEIVSYANQQYEFLGQTSAAGKELYALLKTAEKENKIDPTGVLVNKLPTFRQSTQAIEQRIQMVKDQIALIKSPAYVNLFKPMSNADMQAISNAQQSLSMSNSLQDNLRALEKVDIVLKKAYKQVLQSTGVDINTAFNYQPDVVGKTPIKKEQPNPFKLK